MGGEAGTGLKPGGCGGGPCPVEWKSGRAPSVTPGTAKRKCGWSELRVLTAHGGRTGPTQTESLPKSRLVILGVPGPS